MVTTNCGIPDLDRRSFLRQSAAGLPGVWGRSAPNATGLAASPALPLAAARSGSKEPTKFQIACMTLPYSQLPLDRALTGLKDAGYKYVAWGTSHKEAGGKPVPVMAADAKPEQAKELGKRCRDLGLEPLMLFAGVYPEARNHVEVMTNRIRQASAGGVPQVL